MDYRVELGEKVGARAVVEAKRSYLGLSAWVRMIVGRELDRKKRLGKREE